MGMTLAEKILAAHSGRPARRRADGEVRTNP